MIQINLIYCGVNKKKEPKVRRRGRGEQNAECEKKRGGGGGVKSASNFFQFL
jgi:hypothetical protein